MSGYPLALVFLATHLGLATAEQCYRCFGSDWCSNPSDPIFASKASVINCPATALDLEQQSDILIGKWLPQNKSDVQTATWGCVTATIHEDHEVHTVRTCLNNAATICPTVQSVILNPDTNDVPEGLVLDCEGCVGELCNDHQFVEPNDDSSTDDSSTSSISSSSTDGTPSSTSVTSPTTPSGPLQCYRCFGSNWCNDVNDPDFQANALVIDCPSSFANEYSGDSPVIARFLDNLDQASSNVSVQSTWGCVTATIHENHEIHTVRTCLNNAAIICPTVQSVILNPDVNDVPSDVVLDCDGCQGDLCNDHVFVDPSASSPSSSTSVTSPTTPETTTPSGPLQCYRCFGGNWCNDVNDPEFQSNAMIIDCPASSFAHHEYSGNNLAIATFLTNLDKASNASSFIEASVQSTWGCVTATIHEAHEIHTVRTCLNNAAIICPTVQSVILNPDLNDVPSDVVLDCDGCQGSLCNDHVFVDPSASLPSSGTSSPTSTTSPETTTPSGPLQCYRCFGGNWCNDVNDPDFQSNAIIIDCPASSLAHHEYSGGNVAIATFLDKLDKASLNASASVQSTWGCVTATIHESHEIHTVRTCLNNAAIICPTVQSVILNPDVNDVPSDVILDCDGCQGHLCNDHVFVDPSASSPSTGTPSSTSVTSPTTPESTTPSGPLQCYRCFGSNWCNDVNNPDFQTNAMIVDCPASSFAHHEYSGDNLAIATFLTNLDKASNASSFIEASVQSTWGCVTATIHEAHEIHTVRTCLNNAAIICPTVQSVILNPDLNDVPSDVVLDCDGCQGSLCNDHVFVDPSASSPSSGTSSTTSTTSPEITTPSGPLQCYRCFGGNWCNDVNDPDFQSNAIIIDCPASSLAHHEYSGGNVAIATFLDKLDKASLNASASVQSTWGCVTATIHESHEIHTVRTCLNNAAIICPTVQSVILNPDVNDVPSDVILDCDGCQGHLCNDHVFVDPNASSPSSTSVTTPETTTPSGPLRCYRCFGGNWCNDVNDPNFQSNAMIIDCPASSFDHYEYSGHSPAIAQFLDSLNEASSNVSSLDASLRSTWGCVTATIHEAHEIHTVRTCLNNAAVICPTVQSVILNPDVNDVPSDVILDCDGCQGHLCNDHVFVDPSASSPSTGTPSSTSVTSPTTPEATTPSGPLQCYRCFGSNWCNDVNNPEFQSNAMIIDCPASSFAHHEYSGDNLAIATFLTNLDKASNASSFIEASVQSTWGCVTATIHEAHEIHTVRTCLNNAAIICPTVQSVILNPDLNDVPSDVVLDCDGCQGSLCNDHVFVDPSASSPSSGTSSTTSTTSPETTTPSGPLQCYRCFGGNWCNDVNDPDFQSNAIIIDCPASSFAHHEYSGGNVAIATFLDKLDKASLNASASVQSTWGCVTATIHENHEIHTVRTCLNNAAIICPTVQSVILNPDVNDVPSDVILDCDGCQGHLCNDHVFVDPNASSPSSTSVTTPETTTPSGPLRCYRCFGGNWCNDVNDPNFQSNAMIIDCPASSFDHYEYSGHSPAIAQFLDSLNEASSNVSSLDASLRSTWGCVTATIHEAHEIHTVRTCLNNAAVICPTVQSVILNPDVNDVPSDVILDCDGCQGHLCNDHVFVDPSASSPSTGTPSSTSVTSPTTPEATTPSGPLQCYRCFGGNWCNDVNNPDFQSYAMIIDCLATSFAHHEYSGDNLAIAKFLNSMDKISSNASLDQSLRSTWGCVTATIHENHEIHTVRTCLNNAAIICPTVQAVILNPDVNDVPSDVILDCDGCQGHLCNDHVFVDPNASTPTSVATSTTPETTTPSGPLQCYRCFGGNWCNDVNNPDFQSNATIIDCPASNFAHHDYDGDSLAIATFLDNLDHLNVDGSLRSTWGCVTATIHEAHEVHTVRTCLNNAAIICPTVQSVILNPDVNDVPSDVTLDCQGCVGSLCNDHIFIDPEDTTTPLLPSTTSSSEASTSTSSIVSSTTPTEDHTTTTEIPTSSSTSSTVSSSSSQTSQATTTTSSPEVPDIPTTTERPDVTLNGCSLSVPLGLIVSAIIMLMV